MNNCVQNLSANMIATFQLSLQSSFIVLGFIICFVFSISSLLGRYRNMYLSTTEDSCFETWHWFVFCMHIFTQVFKHQGSLQDLLFVHILILNIMNIIPQKEKKITLKVTSLCYLCAVFNSFVVNIGCFITIVFLLVKLISDEDSGYFIEMVFQESQQCQSVLSLICCVGCSLPRRTKSKPEGGGRQLWQGCDANLSSKYNFLSERTLSQF